MKVGNHRVVAEVRFIKQVPCTYLRVYFDEDTGLLTMRLSINT